MAKTQEFHEYPRIVFHPETGASTTVAKEADVPLGWLARHPDDPAHGDGMILAVPAHEGQIPDDEPASGPVDDPRERERRETPTDRTKIIARLKHYGVKFGQRQPTTELYERLVAYEDNELRIQAAAR